MVHALYLTLQWSIICIFFHVLAQNLYPICVKTVFDSVVLDFLMFCGDDQAFA